MNSITMKITKKVAIIIAAMIILYFTIYIFSDLIMQIVNPINPTKASPLYTQFRIIPELKNAENISWLENSRIVYTQTTSTEATSTNLLSYTLSSRETSTIAKDLEYPIKISVVDEKLLACSWRNFVINNPKEIATRIKITDIDISEATKSKTTLVGSFESNLTIKPITCDSTSIIAENALPILESQKYQIDFKKNEITKLSSTTTTSELKNIISFDKTLLPVEIDITQIFPSPSGRAFILQDSNSNTYFFTLDP